MTTGADRKRATACITAAALAIWGIGCGAFFDVDALDKSERGDAAQGDAEVVDSGVLDAPSSDGRGPTGLDEGVALPAMDAAACSFVAFTTTDCPNDEACRLATPDSGRCESCEGRCKGGFGATCTRTYDCEAHLECFRQRCMDACSVGERACGSVEACIDVGGQTGICNPASL